MRRTRVAATALAVLFAASAPLVGDAAAEDAGGDVPVKVAFVYHFIKFVEWPASAFADETAPLVLAVAGTDAQAGACAQLAGRSVKGRTIEVRRVSRPPEVAGAHVLLLWSADGVRVAEFLRAGPTAHRLTIGDDVEFARGGGMIGFVTVEQRVRFEIHLGAVRRAGLKLSSQLLKLARTVVE